MKKVFVYTRVSTAQQIDGDGHPRQEAACYDFIDAKGAWEVVRTFNEQTSGTVEAMDRKILSECIELCGAAFDVHTIVVERADRIARDLIVSELFFRECARRGIEVYSADSGEELVNSDADPSRKLIRQVLGALAQWEKSSTAKKLLAGRKRTKELTGFPCGGKPVFGTKPEQVKWVWRILRMHRDGQSTAGIRNRLNYYGPYRLEKIRKHWFPGQISRVIETWNHRQEFSHEKMVQILLDPEQTKLIFP